MPKTWDQMTPAEKIEDLRRDMLSTMATVNQCVHNQQQLGAYHNDLMHKHAATSSLASEVAAAVRALEQKIATLKS